MNISYNWLKELVDLDLSVEETAKALTRVGLAVEGIHPHGDDFVLDIDLTSNRPDCLSHRGVARELGVITGRPYANESGVTGYVDTSADAVPFPSVLAPEIVRIEAPELCHRFTARIIRGVTIGPSPKWLVDRLEAIGERAINNVADITNYVMHELGQPMHAFDLDKLAEKRIVVRRARDGEHIKTLDEIDRGLDTSMLAICDSEKPVAVAGIMGGFDSAISDATKDVLLEVAYFSREGIRNTSRKLNLTTEASYRFERGVDIENIERVSDRAAALIQELAGGEVSDIVDIYPVKFTSKDIKAPNISAAVKRLTGLSVSDEECRRILKALGIKPASDSETARGDAVIYRAPSWRHDIAIEEDLVEEVARHFGYENITTELPPAYGAGEYQPTEARKKAARQALLGLGFDEAISYSFIEMEFDELFEMVPNLGDAGAREAFVTLRDSVIEGAMRMRPTLMPGLLAAVRHNLNQQRRNLKLFEIGKVFETPGVNEELPKEREVLAIAISGGEMEAGRAKSVRNFDFYDAKGAIEAALQGAGHGIASFSSVDVHHLQKGQAAAIYLGALRIGAVGRINREIADHYKFKQPVYVAEIDLQAVFETPGEPISYRALSKYPPVIRDITLSVKRSTNFSDVRESIIGRGVEGCRSVSFVDVYEGEGMAEDERALTIRVEYRRDDRTLVEEEVEVLHKELVQFLEQNLNIRPRI